MDETETSNPNRQRMAGRRCRQTRLTASRGGQSRELLTGRGRTVLSQRLVALRRDLAAAARRHREIEHGPCLAPRDDSDELRGRILNLGQEINQLEALLELAEHPELETGRRIGPGTVITVVDAADGQSTEYRLVGCEPDSDSSVISVGSPLGQALLGRQLGSLVTLNLPDGMRRVRVVSTHPIERATPTRLRRGRLERR